MASANNSSSTTCDTPVYIGAGDVEKGGQGATHVQRMITPGGHPVDFSQPAIPVQHRKYGNPIPVGLISFAFGFLLIGLFTVNARGVTIPMVAIPSVILFLGITQTLVGWFEMFIGNTYSATIFCSFGGFAMGYAGIFIPAFGVLPAYTDPETGAPLPEFGQAIGLYFITWAVVVFLFILASFRSSGAILATLVATLFAFITLAIQNFTGTRSAQLAAGAFCFIDACCGFWAAMAGYWTPDTTFKFIHVSPIDLSPKE